MSVTIREAAVADAQAISKLLEELGYHLDRVSVAGKISSFRDAPSSCGYVADQDGKVIGMISMSVIPLFETVGYVGRITSLIVPKEHRGQGVGQALVAKVEEFAWANSCSHIEVQGGKYRDGSERFYSDLGYDINDPRFIKHKPHGL